MDASSGQGQGKVEGEAEAVEMAERATQKDAPDWTQGEFVRKRVQGVCTVSTKIREAVPNSA